VYLNEFEHYKLKLQHNSRYIKVVFLVVLVSTILPPFINNSASISSNKSQIPSTLSEELVFTFNESYQEQVFFLQFGSLSLYEFNKLTFSFIVTGAASTPEGLNVTFIFCNSSIEFNIDTLFQDSQVHNLTETFLLSDTYVGTLEVAVICSGQSSGSAGNLTIFDTTIDKIVSPTLTEDEITLPIFPEWISFQGTLSEVSRKVSTAFFNYNETALLDLSLSFEANYFRSFDKIVYVFLNDKLVDEKNFQANSSNALEFKILPDQGFNLLEICFSVSVCYLDTIEITNIQLLASLTDSFLEDSVFASFEWENDFSHSFDLSSLKPAKYYSDQVLHIVITYQCFGITILPYMIYYLSSGPTVLEEGQLGYSQQTEEKHSLEFHTFTKSYHENLSFTIQGSSTGVGTFVILNSTSIETSTIQDIAEEPLDTLLTEERIISSTALFYSFSYYDVFQTSTSSYISLAVNFDLSSTYEHPFESVEVVVNVNGLPRISQDLGELGFTNLTISFNLSQDYYEIKVIFNFYQLNTPVFLQNLRYQIVETSPSVEEQPLFSFSPLSSTSWLLAIYGATFCWFINKKRYREKRRKKVDIAGTDSGLETKRDELFRLILATLSAACTLVICIFLFYHFDFAFWVRMVTILFFPSLVGLIVVSSNISLNSFKKVGTEITDFFKEVDSVICLVNKIIKSFGNRIKKQKSKFTLISLSIIVVVINYLILFSTSLKLSQMQPILGFFSYLPEFSFISYLLLYISLGVFGFTLLYLLQFTSEMAFLEDNYKRMKTLLLLCLISNSFLLLAINLAFILSSLDFSLLFGFLSPAALGLMIKPSKNLAKIYASEEKVSSETFFEQGHYLTSWKTINQAIDANVRTRTKWEQEVSFPQKKERVREVIMYKLEQESSEENQLEIQTPASRIAEMAKLTVETTDEILQQLYREVPELGKYYPISRVYVKNRKLTTKKIELREKIVPDKYEGGEKKVEMKEVKKEKLSTAERFQKMYEEIAGETEEEKKRTLEDTNGLTKRETEVYLNFLKKGLGDQTIELTDGDIEFIQKALKKLNPGYDKLRRNYPENLFKEMYDILALKIHGFDDVIFRIENDKFRVIFGEFKGGDYVATHPWDYIPKIYYHEKRRKLNKKQLFDYVNTNKMKHEVFNTKFTKLEGKNVPTFILKLFHDRNKEYHAIGNNWIIKFKNGDLSEALNQLVKQGKISEKTSKRLLKGMFEQNEIIALAQNGHVIKIAPNKKKTISIDDKTDIIFNGVSVQFSYKFFLPNIIQEEDKEYLTLLGYFEEHSENTKFIRDLIPREKLPKEITEDELLVLHSKIKRRFLLNLFNTKRLDNLVDFVAGRTYYSLDTLGSKELNESIYNWFDNFDKRRGISWFYDYFNHFALDFLHPNDFRFLFKENLEQSLYAKLSQIITEPTYVFDSHEDEFPLSSVLFEKYPFELLSLIKIKKDLRYPPRFNFWDYKIPPSIGVILVKKKKKEPYLHKPKTGGLLSAKIIGIKLRKEDILLNFPFRWDKSCGGFIFGRHSKDKNKVTEIGDAWSEWMTSRNLKLPSGPSGIIPDESVIVLFLEWRERMINFIQQKILSNSNFLNFCKKSNLLIDKESQCLFSENKEKYSLAKVSMEKGGRLKRLETWKFFIDPSLAINNMIQILKASIFDLTTQIKKVDSHKIKNWEEWLQDNWLEEFNSIKKYFY